MTDERPGERHRRAARSHMAAAERELAAAGWKRCKRNKHASHHPSNVECDCMRGGKVVSIKSRAITYARRYPGQSATQIAHALRANPSTVSSVLFRAYKDGKLMRSAPVVGADHWAPKSGGGPRGGHTYGPSEAAPRSWHDEVVDLVRSGQIIAAIRHVRMVTGLGLLPARDVVDSGRGISDFSISIGPVPAALVGLQKRCLAARKGAVPT